MGTLYLAYKDNLFVGFFHNYLSDFNCGGELAKKYKATETTEEKQDLLSQHSLKLLLEMDAQLHLFYYQENHEVFKNPYKILSDLKFVSLPGDSDRYEINIFRDRYVRLFSEGVRQIRQKDYVQFHFDRDGSLIALLDGRLSTRLRPKITKLIVCGFVPDWVDCQVRYYDQTSHQLKLWRQLDENKDDDEHAEEV